MAGNAGEVMNPYDVQVGRYIRAVMLGSSREAVGKLETVTGLLIKVARRKSFDEVRRSVLYREIGRLQHLAPRHFPDAFHIAGQLVECEDRILAILSQVHCTLARFTEKKGEFAKPKFAPPTPATADSDSVPAVNVTPYAVNGQTPATETPLPS